MIFRKKDLSFFWSLMFFYQCRTLRIVFSSPFRHLSFFSGFQFLWPSVKHLAIFYFPRSFSWCLFVTRNFSFYPHFQKHVFLSPFRHLLFFSKFQFLWPSVAHLTIYDFPRLFFFVFIFYTKFSVLSSKVKFSNQGPATCLFSRHRFSGFHTAFTDIQKKEHL